MTDEYVPELGTNPATIEMYDAYFNGPNGGLLKTRIEDAARTVDINPGLLAASMFAEHLVSSYTRQTGEVQGWLIGLDDYKTAKADIERVVPSARTIKPIRYEPQTNEQGRLIPEVPVLKAADAVLASAVYLKYSEEKARLAFRELGGGFDRLPVEEQFGLVRFGMNAGHGAMKKRIRELLGARQVGGKFQFDQPRKEFLQYKPGKLVNGQEQFDARFPGRAATAHTSQAIHLSQKVFGINPSGMGDSLMFIR